MSGEHSEYCKAYGCPLPGVVSTSTSGGTDWFCPYHFSKNATEWAPITAELQRVKWLADAVTAIRRYSARDCWPRVYANIKHEFTLNQRKDLLNRSGESALHWANRLDRELRDMCAGKAPMPLMQVVEEPQGA